MKCQGNWTLGYNLYKWVACMHHALDENVLEAKYINTLSDMSSGVDMFYVAAVVVFFEEWDVRDVNYYWD